METWPFHSTKIPFDYFNYFQLYDPHTCNFITVNVIPISPTLLNTAITLTGPKYMRIGKMCFGGSNTVCP